MICKILILWSNAWNLSIFMIAWFFRELVSIEINCGLSQCNTSNSVPNRVNEFWHLFCSKILIRIMMNVLLVSIIRNGALKSFSELNIFLTIVVINVEFFTAARIFNRFAAFIRSILLQFLIHLFLQTKRVRIISSLLVLVEFTLILIKEHRLGLEAVVVLVIRVTVTLNVSLVARKPSLIGKWGVAFQEDLIEGSCILSRLFWGRLTVRRCWLLILFWFLSSAHLFCTLIIILSFFLKHLSCTFILLIYDILISLQCYFGLFGIALVFNFVWI